MADGFRFDYDEELEWAVYQEAYEVAVDDQTVSGLLSVPLGATGLAILLEPGAGHLAGLADGLAEVGVASLRLDQAALESGPVGPANLDPGTAVGLLAEQLLAIVEGLKAGESTAHLRIGILASATTAAAALEAAALEPSSVAALVLYNGRLDLAGGGFVRVPAAVLFVLDDGNQALVEINEQARLLLRGERQLAVVRPPRAPMSTTDEPGLERLSRSWFSRHL